MARYIAVNSGLSITSIHIVGEPSTLYLPLSDNQMKVPLPTVVVDRLMVTGFRSAERALYHTGLLSTTIEKKELFASCVKINNI